MRLVRFLAAMLLVAGMTAVVAVPPAYAAGEVTIEGPTYDPKYNGVEVKFKITNNLSESVWVTVSRDGGRKGQQHSLPKKGNNGYRQEISVKVACDLRTGRIQVEYGTGGDHKLGGPYFSYSLPACPSPDAPRVPGGNNAPAAQPSTSSLAKTGLMEPGSSLEAAVLWAPIFLVAGTVFLLASSRRWPGIFRRLRRFMLRH